MIALILDTSILYSEGLYSRQIQLLMRLSRAGHVQVYIPEIVKREFLTRRIDESKKNVRDASNKLSLVVKNLLQKTTWHSEIIETQQKCRDIEKGIEERINKSFDGWVAHHRISIIPFDVNCMNIVMDEYFLGLGVYRKVKSREDIQMR